MKAKIPLARRCIMVWNENTSTEVLENLRNALAYRMENTSGGTRAEAVENYTKVIEEINRRAAEERKKETEARRTRHAQRKKRPPKTGGVVLSNLYMDDTSLSLETLGAAVLLKRHHGDLTQLEERIDIIHAQRIANELVKKGYAKRNGHRLIFYRQEGE